MKFFKSDEVIIKLKNKYKKKIEIDYDCISSIYNRDRYQIIYDINLDDEYGYLKDLNGILSFCTNDNGKLKKWFEKEGIKVIYPWTV